MSAIAQTFIDTTVLDLDALRRMTYAELDTLYRSARCPSAISELNGDTRGAMLAWRSPRTGPIAWWLRTYGASSAFPWEGKTFRDEVEPTSWEPDQGRGINRVNFFGKRRWFPFKTRFAPSFLDGKPTFQLDYSGPANPQFIRSIVDEIREVGPGLYLGPAALNFRDRPRAVLFFAVSHR
ncbi:MAG TPA: hypothetical protein VJS13_02075 [Pyrinomonadaceae bacterium]|nr:hypothetical protein [Pyrinomonadaceae bacterium]